MRAEDVCLRNEGPALDSRSYEAQLQIQCLATGEDHSPSPTRSQQEAVDWCRHGYPSGVRTGWVALLVVIMPAVGELAAESPCAT